MQFALAWRNVWRNPKRTAVILLAVVTGVWVMVFLGALSRGLLEDMVQNSINTLTGHIQIHQTGYREDPSLDRSIEKPDTIEKFLSEALPEGSKWTTRVKADVVLGNARHSGGITLEGISFDEEKGISFIGDSVQLSEGYNWGTLPRNAVIVGQALLDEYETSPGNKLIITSRDVHGELVNQSFRIAGTYHATMETTEKQFAFIQRSAAQDFLKLESSVSEFAIIIPDQDRSEEVARAIRVKLSNDGLEVDTWRDLLPFIDAYLNLWDGMMLIWDLIIFVAMGFGLVNTLLMAVFERIREFGLVRALGMRPILIVQGVLLESALILVTGLLVGNILAMLTVWGFSNGGINLSAFAEGNEMWGGSRIVYPSLAMKDVLVANGLIAALGVLVSLYPAIMAARFSPVRALKQT